MVVVPEFDAASFTSGTYLYADRLAAQMVGSDLRRYMENEHRILFNREGLSSTITVKATSGGVRTLSVNGKADASDDQDMATQTMLAHVPALLHPAPQDVAVIGLASGVSAHAVAQHPRCVPSIASKSMPRCRRPAVFRARERRILDDPRCTRHQDGLNISPHRPDVRRHYLGAVEPVDRRHREPVHAGFLEACRDRLRPAALMCLWIHVYGLDAHAISSVMRTFLEVFPSDVVGEHLCFGLPARGTKGPTRVGWEDLKVRLAEPAVAADLARVGVRSPSISCCET